MIFFDFNDLQLICEDQIPAIFVLTTGLSLEYNRYRFKDLIDFRRKCPGLLDIPSILFRKRLIRKDYYKGFEVLYKTKFPQSYIKNSEFLYINYPIRYKVQYLKLLSYRPINDFNNWIPTDYLENLQTLKDNQLLRVTPNRIYFKYEENIK